VIIEKEWGDTEDVYQTGAPRVRSLGEELVIGKVNRMKKEEGYRDKGEVPERWDWGCEKGNAFVTRAVCYT